MEKASLFIMIKREEYVGRLIRFPQQGSQIYGEKLGRQPPSKAIVIEGGFLCASGFLLCS